MQRGRRATSAAPPSWWLTGGSLIGLVVGAAIGTWVHAHPTPATSAAVAAVTPLGRLWVNALRMTIVPLIVSQIIVAIVSARGRAVGRIGAIWLLTFTVLLIFAGLFTVSAGPSLIAYFAPPPGALASLAASTSAASAAAPESFSTWIVRLVPENPLRAAVQDDLLPLLLFCVMFALALMRTAHEGYAVVVTLLRAVADTMVVLVAWILRAAPFGVFALSLPLAADVGAGLARVVIAFIIILCLLLVVFTAVLYPIAAFVGRVPLWRFASALLPIQAIAFSTRSSLATLPAQIEAADRQLGLPQFVSAFVVPLGVSTFKINRIISSPTKLLFLAYLYGIHLSPFQIMAFVLTMIVLSFTTLGIPSGGSSLKSLPLYVAAGIPPEAVVIFEAIDAVPDMFKTVANVTANLTVAAVVARLAPETSPQLVDTRIPAERAAAAL